MSELTTPIRIDIPGVGSIESADLYLKSEADKVIARHKYKRCLAMAQICYKNSVACANYTMPHEKYKHWRRWQTIWSEFAKRFKTNSTAQQGKEEAK